MHPDLFKLPFLGGRVVHTYGVLLLIGFLLSLWRAVTVARRNGEKPITTQDVLDVSVCLLLAGIVGARLAFVLLDPHLRLYTIAEAVAIWNGGITFDGALIGGLLAIVAFCKLRRLPILPMLDLLGPASVIGYAVGRIGCFFNGCCYGGPTNLPWGVKFPEGIVDGLQVYSVPCHPAQLYSTVMSLLLFGLLALRQKKKGLPSGDLFCWYLIGTSVERFIMELFRRGVTSDMVRGTPLTTAQWFCVALGLAGAAWLVAIHRHARASKPDATPAGDAI
ncbi:MAG: prolipoprotein diacylglyceryl transferase [Capsulimonadaceae bacterium]|nr:prolipoprotein diacylglyceryl transferase [Capsulimonadaceae bacterium]